MLEELLIIFIVLLMLYYCILEFKKAKSLPPGPFAWPIIGNIGMFKKDPHGYLKFTQLAEKYGNVYRLNGNSGIFDRLNGYDAIFNRLNGYDVIFNRLNGYDAIFNRLNGYDAIFNRLNGYDAIFNRLNGYDAIFNRLNGYDAIFNRLNGYDAISNRLNGYDAISNRLNGYDAISNRLNGYDAISNRLNGYDAISNRLNGYDAISNRLNGYDVISNRLNVYDVISNRLNVYDAILDMLNGYQGGSRLNGYDVIFNRLNCYDAVFNRLNGYTFTFNRLNGYDAIFNRLNGNTVIFDRSNGCDAIFNRLNGYDAIFNRLNGYDAIFNRLNVYDAIFNRLSSYDAIFNELSSYDAIFNELSSYDAIFNRLSSYDAIFNELSSYDAIFNRLYCGSTMIVMLNGYDAIHEAFTKQSEIFTDRPQLFAPLIGVSKGTGLTYNSGRPWKSLRRFTLQALRDFGVGKLTLEERIREEIIVLTNIIKESKCSPIRVKPFLLSAATNIICSVMFGARFDYDDTKFVELVEVLEGIFKLNAPFAKENFFPITRTWPSGRELIRKRTAAIERVKRYLSETIEEHQASFDSENIRDFIDLYIKASKDDSEPELFTESNVYKIIVDLFLAGGETTGTSLDWSLLYMMMYPDIQERCYNEIIQVTGSGRPVSLGDRPELHYVQAVLLELQRISNTLTFSLPHVASKDAMLLGYKIPKDSIVIANLYSAHIDEKYWTEPEKFQPQRFLDDNGKLVRKDGLVPFGDGPRLCIGEPLARMELFLIFTNLIKTFKFTKHDQEQYSMEGIQALTLTARPYELIAKLRNDY
ncbi:hypothetical protein ACF0H5_016961 [Mactra antiquata]